MKKPKPGTSLKDLGLNKAMPVTPGAPLSRINRFGKKQGKRG